MKTQKALGIPSTAVFMLTVFLILSQVSLGQGIPDRETQEEKRSELLSRRALPKWLEVLPNSVPQWMKVEASKYRGSPQQIICAVKNMSKALNDMQAARARNCDDYFRCRGSHDASQCGAYAASFVTRIRLAFEKPSWSSVSYSLLPMKNSPSAHFPAKDRFESQRAAGTQSNATNEHEGSFMS
ncbi:hypothetical protein ACROYT_G007579 [Oculina patagonica]